MIYVYGGIGVLMAIALVTSAVWWWRRRAGGLRLPCSARRIDWTTRIIDMAVLTLLGAALWYISNRPAMDDWEYARPGMVAAYIKAWWIVGGSLAGVILLGLLWRTWAAALAFLPWCGLVVLLLFGNPSEALKKWAGPDARPRTFITFQDDGLAGAEFYINGVHIGQLPLTITADDFLAKVPYWEQAPEGLDINNDFWAFALDEHTQSKQKQLERPWGLLKFFSATLDPLREGHYGSHDRPYFCQAQLDGEWGYVYSGGGGGGGGGFVRRCEFELRIVLPKADEAIKQRLKQAKRSDFVLTDEWVDRTMADPHAHRFVNQQLVQKCVASVAERRYGLSDVTDAASAWRVLQDVRKACDDGNAYNTHGPEAHALRAIVPMLDMQQLADEAVRVIRRDRDHLRVPRAFSDPWDRRPETDNDPRALYPGLGGPRTGATALMYAVQLADAHLDDQDDSKPNVFETRVMDELVYRSTDRWGRQPAVNVATDMGWPGIYRFLIRHDWQREIHDRWNDADGHRIHSDAMVNQWLLRLLFLDTPDGRAFRQKYHGWATQMVDKVVRVENNGDVSVSMDEIEFLFLDNDLGEESPAVQGWGRLLSATWAGGQTAINARFEFLKRMGDLATVDRYVNAWHHTRRDPQWLFSHYVDRLPHEKAIAVSQGIIKRIGVIRARSDEHIHRQQWMTDQVLDREQAAFEKVIAEHQADTERRQRRTAQKQKTSG